MNINKIIILLLLVIGYLLAMPVKSYAADALLYLSPSSTTADTGCYPKLDVMLDTGGQEAVGVDVIINYDSTKLEAYSLAKGILFSNYETLDTATAGKIVIQARASAGEVFMTNAGSAQKLAVITFKTKAYGSASAAFKFIEAGDTTDTNISASGGIDLLTSVTDATIVIEDGASCPSATGTTPTPTPTSTNVGGNTSATATPTSYSAPDTGAVENTIALTVFGMVFILLSGGLVLVRK